MPFQCWYALTRTVSSRGERILDAGMMSLDPSIVPSEDFGGARSALLKTSKCSVLCIDATRPRVYKPTSLPRRKFMEGAIEIWQQLELPPLKFKAPWYGYELGYWSDRNREEAELALQGKHFEIGERAKKERKKLE